MPNIGSPERGIHKSPPPWLDEPYLADLLRDTVAPEVIERMRKAMSRRDPALAERNRKNYDILKRSVAKLGAAGAPSFSAPTPGSRTISSAMPSRRNLSSWWRPA